MKMPTPAFEVMDGDDGSPSSPAPAPASDPKKGPIKSGDNGGPSKGSNNKTPKSGTKGGARSMSGKGKLRKKKN